MNRRKYHLLTLFAAASALIGISLNFWGFTPGNFIELCLLAGAIEIIAFGLPAFFIFIRSGKSASDLISNYRPMHMRSAALSVLAAVSYTLVGALITVLFSALLSKLKLNANLSQSIMPKTFADLMVSILCMALIPALCEELFFRELLQTALIRRFGIRAGILISALIFSVVHLNLVGVAAIFIIGLVLSSLRLRYHSLALPFLFHSVYNTSVLIINFSGQSNPSFVSVQLCLIAFIFALYSLFKKEKPHAL